MGFYGGGAFDLQGSRVWRTTIVVTACELWGERGIIDKGRKNFREDSKKEYPLFREFKHQGLWA